MDKVNLFRDLRIGLVLANTFGFIFAFIGLILSYRTAFSLLLFCISGGLCGLVLRKSTQTPGVQLPVSPNDTILPSLKRVPRRPLIAAVDFILGTILIAGHIFSVVGGRHYYGTEVLTLYATFAMLLSAVLHYVLCVLHIKAWRDENMRSKPRCPHCQQRVKHCVEYGQGVQADEARMSAKDVSDSTVAVSA